MKLLFFSSFKTLEWKEPRENYGIRRMRLQSARMSIITGSRRQRKAKERRRKGGHQVVKDFNVFDCGTANYFSDYGPRAAGSAAAFDAT